MSETVHLEAADVRDRSARLFDYLRALRALREPPVRDIQAYRDQIWRIADLPAVPELRVGPRDDGAWLSLTKPTRPEQPPVPEELTSFVGPYPADLLAPPSLLGDEVEAVGDSGYPNAIRESYERWVSETWQRWSDEVGPIV